MSARRTVEWKRYQTFWYGLIDEMRKIEDAYLEVRQSGNDIGRQNALYLQINTLQVSLRRYAERRKILLITRHGETESDIPMGPPGSDDEVLTSL